MTTAVTRTDQAALTTVATLSEKAYAYALASKADNTKRAYSADWQHFVTWCDRHGLPSLPAAPSTVANYLVELIDPTEPKDPKDPNGPRKAPRRASTIARHLTTISQAHKHAGHESPTTDKTVVSTWQGIKRTHGTHREGKAPTLAADVRRMVETLTTGAKSTRDKALLLLGFAGAFRRSELVALDVADLLFVREGLEVTIKRSKTDQEGQGTIKAIAYAPEAAVCPVRAVLDWLNTSQRKTGALFVDVNKAGRIGSDRLSDKAIARLVKDRAAAAGLDPTHYSGHSLRSGHVTTAYDAGADEGSISSVTGHKSVTVLRQYDRRSRWVKNSSTRLWSSS